MTDSDNQNDRPDEVPESPGTPSAADEKAPTAPVSEPYRPKHVPLWNNFISMGGIFLAIVGVLGLLTFALLHLVSPQPNPYVDIFGYLVLPSILLLGFMLIPTGIFLNSWWIQRRNPEQRLAFRFPRIDLNDPRQRKAAKIVIGVTFVLMPVVGVSSYHGYQYTDSATFCAAACHTVMHPQAIAYEQSAHARVPCAECHIGSGASWFVRSKLSGTRQVIAMARESYSRPIPPAISELRPARETCEHCHWPKKFFGAQLREIVHFSADETNTRHDIDMLLKTGGGDETTGRAEGIHKHMALEGLITYVATDESLQDIPWVEQTRVDGQKLVYRSDGFPSSDPQPEGQKRVLDCMDCHNRPAHKFRSPLEAVNTYLDIGKIDTTLPYVKRQAARLLVEDYPDAETAAARIGSELRSFYQDQYPDIWRTRKASVNQAIDAVRQIYENTTFPEMKVNWQTYPDNIGHLYTPGCFRCHDGRHINQFGQAISAECNDCHTFLNSMDANDPSSSIQAGEFIHPFELNGPHSEVMCSRCHTGGLPPDPTCAGCHTFQDGFRAGTLDVFAAFELEPDSMYDMVDCDECHDLAAPPGINTMNGMCLDCHDGEDRIDGMAAGWKEEIGQLVNRAESAADEHGLEVLDALQKAGPLHNMEASRAILNQLAVPLTSPVSTSP